MNVRDELVVMMREPLAVHTPLIHSNGVEDDTLGRRTPPHTRRRGGGMRKWRGNMSVYRRKTNEGME